MKEFNIPMYHGTSSVFLPSIKSHGLGGVNLLNKLNVIPFLKELTTLCKKELNEKCTDWTKAQSIFSLAQGFSEEMESHKHVNVFITPSFERAKKYALQNSLGSETISMAKSLYDKLRINNSYEFQQINSRFRELENLMNTSSSGIVIEIMSLSASSFSTKKGSSYHREFEELEELVNQAPDYLEHSLMDYEFILPHPMALDQLLIHFLDL